MHFGAGPRRSTGCRCSIAAGEVLGPGRRERLAASPRSAGASCACVEPTAGTVADQRHATSPTCPGAQLRPHRRDVSHRLPGPGRRRSTRGCWSATSWPSRCGCTGSGCRGATGDARVGRAARTGWACAPRWPAATRTSCPAGSASGSASPGRCRPSRRCWSPTSRPARSTCRCRRRCSTCSPTCSATSGFACLFITHDLSAVEYLADDIAVMYLGQLVEQGRRERIFAAPARTRTRRRCCPPRPIADPVRQRHRQPVAARRRPARPRSTRRPGCRFHTRCPLAFDRCAHRGARRCAPIGDGDGRVPPGPPDGTGPDVRTTDNAGRHRMTFTTRPTLQGTFGMVSSTHWLASQSAMAHAGARRQRLRRGGRRRVRPARRRAAPQRARRRGAGHLATAQDPAPTVLCGQGPAPAGATIAHFTVARASTSCPAPGRSPPRSPAPSTPGCCCCATTAPCRSPRCWSRRSATPSGGHPLLERVGDDRRGRAGAVRGRTGPPRPRSGCADGGRPPPGELFTNPAYAAHPARGWSTRAQAAGGDRDAQIDAARRAWSAGLRRRGGRRVLPGDRSATPAASAHAGPGHRRRPGRLLRDLGGAGHLRLARLHGRQDRALGPGPGAAAELAAARRARRPGGARPVDGRRHPRAAPRRSSSPSPTARPGTATAADVPADDAALPGRTPRSGRALIGDGPPAEVRPGRVRTGASRGSRRTSLDPARAARPAPTDAATGEPTVAAGRRDPGRHLPRRRRRPLGQHGLGHARAAAGCRARPTIPELGFRLGSRLQMFWLEEGLPSSLAPGAGRAPRSPRRWCSATGEPVLACGTPGGDQQDQWQLLFLLRHLVGGQSPAGGHRRPDAGTRPASRARSTRATSSRACWWSRTGSTRTCVERARGRGHDVRLVRRPGRLGRMCAVTRDPETGVLAAGREPARDAGLRHRALTAPVRAPRAVRPAGPGSLCRGVPGRAVRARSSGRSSTGPGGGRRVDVGAGRGLGRVTVAGLDGVDQADVLDPGVRRAVRRRRGGTPTARGGRARWRSTTATGCR